jgi:phage FluMu protein Com
MEFIMATYKCRWCDKYTKKIGTKVSGVYIHKCTKCKKPNEMTIRVDMYDFGPVASIEKVERYLP